MTIIVWDSETTGLLSPIAAGLEYQPHIVEMYAIKLNSDLEKIDTFTCRIKPKIEIPQEAIRVHGITNEDVKDCEPFEYWFLPISNFFLGCNVIVGHNSMFDNMVLFHELSRLGKQMNFPWGIRTICTAEVSSQQNGFRLNLTDLHTKLFGEGFAGAHSASSDCEITAKCFIEMVNRGMIVL